MQSALRYYSEKVLAIFKPQFKSEDLMKHLLGTFRTFDPANKGATQVDLESATAQCLPYQPESFDASLAQVATESSEIAQVTAKLLTAHKERTVTLIVVCRQVTRW